MRTNKWLVRFKLTNDSKAIKEMTQKEYSSCKKGAYGQIETVPISGGGLPVTLSYIRNTPPIIARVRGYNGSVVVLTDKPQKPAPKEVWKKPEQERATA